MRRTRENGLALLVAIPALCALEACGALVPRTDPFVDELVKAQSLQAERYYAEALSMSEDLLKRARNEEEACRVTMVLARSRAGLGQYARALDTFARLSDKCRRFPMASARGLYEMGVLIAEHAADRLDALPVFRAVVTRFPNEPAAKRCVIWIRDIIRERFGPASVITELREMYREVARSSVGPYLVFEAALLEEALDADGPFRALSLYRLIIERHPDSALVDDAQFRSARISLDIGLAWDAVAFLKAIMARRETSLLFGSYDSSMYPKAMFLLAEALYKATGNPDDAIRQYRHFIATYTDSLKRDDAWFRIYELLGESGRKNDARKVLVSLARDFPLSEKGREARRILDGGKK
ncbi:MAG: tetratricopeptide repeat protein [Deltaproteobacteria bacterium]|nr:tetratricopeptide repeat protein [Deltaproteobacteria bacterium]